jgi:hypothetical protein
MIKFNFDIQGLQKQIEQKKKEILLGVNDGFRILGPILEGRMQVYIQTEVYDAYIRTQDCDSGNPHYQRTYRLLNSVRSLIKNNILYIYNDTEGIEFGRDGRPYFYHVLEGGGYDYPWHCKESEGDFNQERNWIEPTKREIIDHFHTGGQLIGIMIDAIQRRVR